MRTRRRGRWLPKQPRLGARMCQGTFFLSYRKLRFHTIKTLRADRTAAEWKNVACATRRRRRILLRRILFHQETNSAAQDFMKREDTSWT